MTRWRYLPVGTGFNGLELTHGRQARSCMEWIASGSATLCLMALTSSKVAYGVNKPAISLIAMESAPIDSSCLACSTKSSLVWAGLVV